MVYNFGIDVYGDLLEYKVDSSDITFTYGAYYTKGELYSRMYMEIYNVNLILDIEEGAIITEFELTRDAEGRNNKINFDYTRPVLIKIVDFSKIKITVTTIFERELSLNFCDNIRELIKEEIEYSLSNSKDYLFFKNNSEAKQFLDTYEPGEYEEYQKQL